MHQLTWHHKDAPAAGGVESRKSSRAGELKAGMLRCDWVEIAALPHRLSIVVAFRNGWVNTGARVGPSKLDELVTGS